MRFALLATFCAHSQLATAPMRSVRPFAHSAARRAPEVFRTGVGADIVRTRKRPKVSSHNLRARAQLGLSFDNQPKLISGKVLSRLATTFQ